MKQSLDFRLGQHLTITPQLQQAIRLLQLSSAELQQEIQEALETNPLLEEREPGEQDVKGESSDNASEPTDTSTTSDDDLAPADVSMEPGSLEETGDSDSDGNSESDWAEVFASPKTSSSRSDDDLPDLDARNTRPQTLRDHLLWQMQMTPF